MPARLIFVLALLFGTAALAAIGTPLDIGATNGASGGTIAITTTRDAPAGSFIGVVVIENLSTIAAYGALADQVGNNYGLGHSGPNLLCAEIDGAFTNGTACLFYVWNNTDLPAGDTITFTRNKSGSNVAMSAFYVPGVYIGGDPLDTGSGAGGLAFSIVTGTGSSLLPGDCVDSTGSKDVGIATVGWGSNASPTQSPGFANPPDYVFVAGANTGMDGGYALNYNASVTPYTPSLSTSSRFATICASFKPALGGVFISTPATVP